jgi:hypothetical protein
MKEGSWTPWGKAQDATQITRGVWWVSTASHGGLAVSLGRAQRVLTEKARSIGIQIGGYRWFEEDSDWAVPAAEHPEWFPKTPLENLVKMAAEVFNRK